MKIYQIHETGGCYEDYYDVIRFTYLNRDKAEKQMEELKLKHNELLKCDNCPLEEIKQNPTRSLASWQFT